MLFALKYCYPPISKAVYEKVSCHFFSYMEVFFKMKINRFNSSSRMLSKNAITKNRTKRKKEPKEAERILSTNRWQKKREWIKKRDHFFCQRCWCKFGIYNAEQLEVHHIKNRIEYMELAFDDDNLITICKTCNLQLGSATKLDFNWTPIKSNIGKEDFVL